MSDWTYETEHDHDEDSTKVTHYAVRGTERVVLDHSPNEYVSAEAFAAHVAANFPKRPRGQAKTGGMGSWPWRNSTIVKFATSRGFA